jgi:hypothetical protein
MRKTTRRQHILSRRHRKKWATITCYGEDDLVHSVEVVIHTPQGEILARRVWTPEDGDLDEVTDEMMEFAVEQHRVEQIYEVDELLSPEYCPCCGHPTSRVVTEDDVARRLLDEAFE